MFRLCFYMLCVGIIVVGVEGCLCSEQEIAEEVLSEAPVLSGIAAASNRVEVRGLTFVQAKIAAEEGKRWYLQWESDCGLVIGVPNDAARASFTAPDKPGICTVTAKVFDDRMLDFNERKLSIMVTPTLDEEIVR